MQKLNKLIFSVGLSVCVLLLTIILVGCSLEVENNFNNSSTGNGGIGNQQINSNFPQNEVSSLVGSNISATTESGDVILGLDDILSSAISGNVSSNKVNATTSTPESSSSQKPATPQKPTTPQKPNDDGWTGDYPIP